MPEDSEDATLLHVGKLGLRGEKLRVGCGPELGSGFR